MSDFAAIPALLIVAGALTVGYVALCLAAVLVMLTIAQAGE